MRLLAKVMSPRNSLPPHSKPGDSWPSTPSDPAPSETAAREHKFGNYVAEARLRRPDLGFEEHAFIRHVAERAPEGVLPPVEYAGDLLLAFCCTRRDSMARLVFYASYSDVITRVLSRRGGRHGAGEDAARTVFERLLVGAPDVPPKLSEYRGTGPLRSWVSTTAATTLLMMQRAEGRRKEEPPDSSASPFIGQLDPELGYLKQRYAGEVHAAIVAALGRLSDRDRTLLRLHLVQRLSIDQLGGMYRVNRATAARWLVAARTNLVDEAKADLSQRLGLSESECDSIVALVRSQLDVSLVRHLAAPVDADSSSEPESAP